jgi:arginase
MNLAAVHATAKAVAERVADAMSAGEQVLVLGGDCTVELGVVAGALEGARSIGLVYLDGDADLNVPATAAGALDWMGVGHLLDLPGAVPELSGLGPRRPLLGPTDILLVGAETITPPEARTIEAKRIEQIKLHELQRDPVAAGRRARAWSARFERFLVHLDVDVMAFTDFPIADNVRYEGRDQGVLIDELAKFLDVLLAAPNCFGLTITEVNPDHAPDEARTFDRLNAVLARALSRASS